MLAYQDLLEIGLSPTAETLQARLVAAAGQLGFGLSGGTLIRGRLASRKASVHGFGNPPAGFLEASRSLDVGLRDPLLAAMQGRPGCYVYDQAFYASAGAGELWDLQAPFGYRHGMAISLHEFSHAEIFCFGVDSPDPLPTNPAERFKLEGALRILALHAHSAAKRLHTAPLAVDLNSLGKGEVEALKWAVDGISKQDEHSDRSRAQRSAAAKLGATSRPMAVLRAIEGGLLER